VSDEFGGDRVVGDFVGVGRVDPGGGKPRIEAPADSPARREVDEVLSGKVGELHAAAVRQCVGGFVDEDHGFLGQFLNGDQLRRRRDG